ncbi:MAG: hypothetical protein K9N09_07070 [Candidatus Cloacimonetes bacterium]|nr:hypothetical protein [Candidatus Cloacimonadota bacterium]MCF7814239.1 hypothetical protein [Candidatus Cloacimonadota bacterium]MCF7868446.1 hypothetical protein [Candidatus Cloacimonadota bacterium]MCF7883934.1 hypothetical protein [Candidatus Cloacimonadota bacterium]
MKKATFLQVLIVLVVVAIWNGLHLGFNYQSQRYEQELSSVPMILVCSEYEPLQNLKTHLDTLQIVKYTVLESDTLIKKNLIQDYQLNNAALLLGNFNVPSVMKIYFNGSTFTVDEKRELENHLNTSYPEVIINFDEYFQRVGLRKIDLLERGYFYANILIAVFLFFSIVLLRIYFESRKYDYWRIFRNAGGKRKVRNINFFLHSLWICIIPVGLNFAAYLAALRYDYLPVKMDIRYFAAEFIFVVLSVFISRIFMGNKF